MTFSELCIACPGKYVHECRKGDMDFWRDEL